MSGLYNTCCIEYPIVTISISGYATCRLH